MTSPLRICLVINSLRCGGAERVAATVANEWATAGCETSLITFAPDGGGFYTLDPRVDLRNLNLLSPSTGFLGGVAANMSRIGRVRREIVALRPDVIVSFIDCMNVLVLLAVAGLRIPVVVSERTDPRRSPLSIGWRALRRLTYRRAAVLVVQTQSVARWARRVVDPRRVVVLTNPVVEGCFRIERTQQRACRVVAIGRLAPEKGFDILIEAFARAAALHPGWTLVIAGEGPLAGDLQRQAGGTVFPDRIEFAGLIQRPEELLAGAAIFVLSSRREGFPNALLEAMACGCCVIATDCRSGPAEIVTSGIDGVLVPVENVAALAGALDSMMTDAAERSRLGAAAAASAERFRATGIAEQWIRLLRSVSARTSVPAPAATDERQLAEE